MFIRIYWFVLRSAYEPSVINLERSGLLFYNIWIVSKIGFDDSDSVGESMLEDLPISFQKPNDAYNNGHSGY